MADRTIYMYPGETLEIRWIADAELPRTAAEWRYQSNCSSDLYRAWPSRIAAANPAIQFDTSLEAWKG